MNKRIEILNALGSEEKSGKELRNKIGMRLAPFYVLMARMEDEQLVEGWYKPVVVAGHKIKQRWYRATPKGRRLPAATLATEAPRPKLGFSF